MADMSMAMQMASQVGLRPPPQQQPPQGGLAQAGGAPPQGGGPSPQMMAQQTTGQALGAEQFEESVANKVSAANYGDQEFAKKMMQLLEAGLPSQQELRKATQMRQQAMDAQMAQLAPEAPDRFSALMRGMTAPIPHNVMTTPGMLGSGMAAMSNAATADYEGQKKRELMKAQMMENELGGYIDKTIGQVEKGLSTQQKLDARKANANKIAGTIVDKAKQAANEKTKGYSGDKTSPEFATLYDQAYQESLKTFLPAYLMGVDGDTANTIMSNLADLEKRVGRGSTSSLVPTPVPTPVPVPPAAVGTGAPPPVLSPGAPGARSDIVDFPGAFTPSEKAVDGTVLGDRAEIIRQEVVRNKEARRVASNPREVENALSNLKSLEREIAMLPKAEREQVERWLAQAEVSAAKGTQVGTDLAARRIGQIQDMVPTPTPPPNTPNLTRNQLKAQQARLEAEEKAAVELKNAEAISTATKRGAEVGKGQGEEIANLPSQEEASKAVQQALKYLEDGIYSGFWGATQKNVASATPFVDKTTVANTEKFLATIGNIVVPRLKEFGGNDSEQELKYLRQISAGDISMQPEALKELLVNIEAKIQRGMDRVKRGQDVNGTPVKPTTKPTGWSVVK